MNDICSNQQRFTNMNRSGGGGGVDTVNRRRTTSKTLNVRLFLAFSAVVAFCLLLWGRAQMTRIATGGLSSDISSSSSIDPMNKRRGGSEDALTLSQRNKEQHQQQYKESANNITGLPQRTFPLRAFGRPAPVLSEAAYVARQQAISLRSSTDSGGVAVQTDPALAKYLVDRAATIVIPLRPAQYFNKQTRKDDDDSRDDRKRQTERRKVLMMVPVNDGYLPFALNLLCSLNELEQQGDLWRRSVDAVKGGGSISRQSSKIQSIPELMNMLSADIQSDETPKKSQSPHSSASYSGFLQGTENKGFVFVSMDAKVDAKLRKMGLPVMRDPDIPFVTDTVAAWANPKFHSLVCTKLIPVIRALEAGVDVLLSDADIAFMKPILPFLRPSTAAGQKEEVEEDADGVDVQFSIGSCHKTISDDFRFKPEGIEKLNTGFYYAKSSPALTRLLRRSLAVCRTTELTGDQPAMNQIILSDAGTNEKLQQKRKQSDDRMKVEDPVRPKNKLSPEEESVYYRYGFFDGCLVSNGCTFFKHLCANNTYDAKYDQETVRKDRKFSTAIKEKKNPEDDTFLSGLATPRAIRHLFPRNEPVAVHANFLVGKEKKMKSLKKYDLWFEKCIAVYNSSLV